MKYILGGRIKPVRTLVISAFASDESEFGGLIAAIGESRSFGIVDFLTGDPFNPTTDTQAKEAANILGADWRCNLGITPEEGVKTSLSFRRILLKVLDRADPDRLLFPTCNNNSSLHISIHEAVSQVLVGAGRIKGPLIDELALIPVTPSGNLVASIWRRLISKKREKENPREKIDAWYPTGSNNIGTEVLFRYGPTAMEQFIRALSVYGTGHYPEEMLRRINLREIKTGSRGILLEPIMDPPYGVMFSPVGTIMTEDLHILKQA